MTLLLVKDLILLSGFLLASWHLCLAGGRCSQVLMKQPMSFNPLKGLARLLTLVEVMRGGRELLGLKSLIQRSYWGNSKRTWLKFSGGNFGFYILLIMFIHDCMGSTDTVCIRQTLSPGLWVRKLSRQCIEWKHRHVWCVRHQNGRKEKKA